MALPGLLCALEPRQWTVEGVVRDGLVHVPSAAKTRPVPVVFAFHGHGGSMQNAARTFALEQLWPEALVVYLQGLPTPGRLTDPEGRRAGWQASAGDQGDRDLKLFDAVLASLKDSVDLTRVYATGHSNGGSFTYLLWAQRPRVFAAFAPSGAIPGRADLAKGLPPKPVLHIAGESDPLVKFAWQSAAVERIRQTNGSAPVETWFWKGGHRFPPEAREKIVAFFRRERGH